MILISVVTVVFNDEENIGKTIESVLSQDISQSELEYIIIDGGSTDGTVDVIKRYINNISVFVSEKDSGIYNAMNKSLKYITGKWCMFLNSGDTLCKYAFDILKIVPNVTTDVAIIHGNVIRSFSQGKVREKMSFEEGEFPHVCHQAAIIRSDVMKTFGYNENYHICADLDFFKKVFDSGYKFFYVNQDIAIYDMNGYSSYNIIKYAKEKKKIGFKLTPLDMLGFYLKSFLARLWPLLYNYLWYKSERNKAILKEVFS